MSKNQTSRGKNTRIYQTTATWTLTVPKIVKFGFHYRWYLPKFIYNWVMDDLQWIERNKTRLYSRDAPKQEAEKKGKDNERSAI